MVKQKKWSLTREQERTVIAALRHGLREAAAMQAEVDAYTPEEWRDLKAAAAKQQNRRKPKGRGPSDWPNYHLLKLEAVYRDQFRNRFRREPRQRETYEYVAAETGLSWTRVRDRLLEVRKQNKSNERP